jgi:hypothetical protein
MRSQILEPSLRRTGKNKQKQTNKQTDRRMRAARVSHPRLRRDRPTSAPGPAAVGDDAFRSDVRHVVGRRQPQRLHLLKGHCGVLYRYSGVLYGYSGVLYGYCGVLYGYSGCRGGLWGCRAVVRVRTAPATALEYP